MFQMEKDGLARNFYFRRFRKRSGRSINHPPPACLALRKIIVNEAVLARCTCFAAEKTSAAIKARPSVNLDTLENVVGGNRIASEFKV